MIDAYVVPHIGDLPLQKVTARDLDRLYSTLRQRGGRSGKGLKGKTVRNVHVMLSKALGDAVKRKHIASNPAAAVDPPGVSDSVERTAWTVDEVRTFLKVASSDRLHAIWKLALATGMRRGELCGLQWPDFDLDACSVTVQRQVQVRVRSTKYEPRLLVRETTKGRTAKGKRSRRVRFDQATGAALKTWKAVQSEERLAFGPAWHTDGGVQTEGDWVLTEPGGIVVHPDTVLRRFKRLVKVAGVTPIVLHGARHSYAELALGAGARLDVVSRQLGHTRTGTTADLYLHDSDEAATEAALRVAQAMEGGQ